MVTQACADSPLQVVADGADRRGDDRLVEGGEEHAQQQADEDRQDLAVGVLAGLAGGEGRVGQVAGGRSAHRESSISLPTSTVAFAAHSLAVRRRVGWVP